MAANLEESCRESRCRICGGRDTGEVYEAREMMHGLRTRFHYAQCADCGCLWLTDPPPDFSPYYSNGYYSFGAVGGGVKRRVEWYLQGVRDATYFGGGGLLGRFLAKHFEDGALVWLSKLGVPRDAKILDVGCGSGRLLRKMAALGFGNLLGVDPFLPKETSNGGVKIRRAYLEDVKDEAYDLVMFQHSLEHLADPAGTLRSAGRILASSGKCLVRLPVVGEAWERYGINWVQLDPPRHMWIATEKAMTLVAEFAGLKVEKTEYDSTPFQFWASELYQRDVPLSKTLPYNINVRLRVRQMREFREKAESLNRAGRGDQAMFLLGKA